MIPGCDSNDNGHCCKYPSKIELDLTNGPLSKLLVAARAVRYSGLGVRSVGPVGDFLENRMALRRVVMRKNRAAVQWPSWSWLSLEFPSH